MSPTFRSVGDRVVMTLEEIEVTLLRDLRDAVRAVVEDADRDDPVIRRLLPRAVDGDRAADAEVRRMIGDELLGARRAGLDALAGLLDRGETRRGRLVVELVDDEPALVLGVVNDLRLALGARAGVGEIDRDTLPADDPRAQMLGVVDHLAWWQEQLLAIIDPEAVAHYEDRDTTP